MMTSVFYTTVARTSGEKDRALLGGGHVMVPEALVAQAAVALPARKPRRRAAAECR